MLQLSAANASDYLAARGMSRPATVRELGGGISNTVLMVETADGRLVLKQSLRKLRVEQEWWSDPERVFRESEALRLLAPHLPAGSLPEVRFEDRENYCFAMSAAPQEAETWKAQLLRGEVQPEVARRVGELLAAMHRASWRDSGWEARFGDQTVFDQLRLDPYYRSTARRHPDLAPQFARLMRESAARRVALVHGDWSPKNFLVSGSTVMAIDFEVVHFGDPAFDTAFLVNHLVLKSLVRPESRKSYASAAAVFLEAVADVPEEATLGHLGALMLARVDGKSPVEYLNDEQRSRVRGAARDLILHPAARVAEVFERL